MKHRKPPGIAVALLALALLIPGILLVGGATTAEAATTTTYGRISVSGSHFLINGAVTDQHFFGVVDTTALQFAILAFVEGQTQYAGKTSVFNGPDTGSSAKIPQHSTASVFWNQYFGLLSHYNCNLVRIGAADIWGTGIQYEAWTHHHTAYLNLLNTMLAAAKSHHVWVVLVLAGSQEYPTYGYGGSGSVFKPGTSAYNNYIAYAKGVMSALEGQTALGWYDMFNEPDHNGVYAKYWSSNGGKTAFRIWACAVAAATAKVSTHPRCMGVAMVDNMFSWGKSNFDLASGTVPFEIADVHYYGSTTDSTNFINLQQWAKADNKPLFWSELGYNKVYPLLRYKFAESAIWAAGGQAITSMVLTGTSGYPYTGGTLPFPTV